MNIKVDKITGKLREDDNNTIGYIPDWQNYYNDTLTGVDLYKYFCKAPTIYFDSNAVNSKNLGTYKNPYTTVAQINARCQGNMSGQTLGIKRGSFVRGKLNLTCYGESGNPFSIVPYGEGKMPTFSGGVVRSSWTTFSTYNTKTIYQHSMAQTEDIFTTSNGYDYTRLLAVNGSSEATVITSIQNYIDNPVVGTIGCFGYYSGKTYAYFANKTNPNDGLVESGNIKAPISIFSPLGNVDGKAGYIEVVGLRSILSRDAGIVMNPAGDYIHDSYSYKIIACCAENTGSQLAVVSESLSGSGISIGKSHSTDVRMTNCTFIGNYCNDILNNTIEGGAVKNSLFINNIGINIGGNSIIEFYDSMSSNVVAFNRGYSDPISTKRVYKYHQCGVWINNLSYDGGGVDNTLTTNNLIFGNYIQDPQAYAFDIAGQNNLIYSNTIVCKNGYSAVATDGGFCFNKFVGGSTATGNQLKDNIFIFDCAAVSTTITISGMRVPEANTPVPTSDYNAYYNFTRASRANYGLSYQAETVNSNTKYYTGTFSNWRTITGQDVHTKVASDLSNYISTGNGSYNISDVGFNYINTIFGTNTYYTLSSNSPLLNNGTDLRTSTNLYNDLDGNVLTSTPNIGCNQASN